MQIRNIVFKELQHRKVRLLANFLAISLAVAVIVSVQSISSSSKVAVTKQMHKLGANMFILPRALSLADFYTADYGHLRMPESYIYRLEKAGLETVEQVKGQLSARITIRDHQAILTGILQEKRPGGSEVLSQGQILLGNEIAELLNVERGRPLEIKEKEFIIAKILPEKGTIDDIRIFAPLSTVQELLGEGRVINLIELISTKIDLQEKVAEEIEALLPETKVVTKKRIAQVQASTLSALKKYSLVLLIVIVFVGGLSIANYMFINVRERRREIGTLLAIGATPRLIIEVFLHKAIILGLIGGLSGYILGTGLAISLGPKIVKMAVRPVPIWLFWSTIIAVIFSLFSSAVPARYAANLDPAQILQEE